VAALNIRGFFFKYPGYISSAKLYVELKPT